MTLSQARKNVNKQTFGTPAWEASMQIVRNMVAAELAAAPKQEYFSVDSGEHRTILLDGRIIG